MRRKAELESQLVRARGTDFANARTDAVEHRHHRARHRPGHRTSRRRFTILGAWDSEPEKGVISYLSPVAQSLLNRKLGEEVEFEVHNVRHRHRIDAIEAFKTA